MEEVLNKKEKQLVYISASIASGCRPCIKYHIKKGVKVGLTDEEINDTLDLAISIRNNATSSLELLARNNKIDENIADNNKESLNSNDILVGISATYSTNFPLALERYLRLGRSSGFNDMILSEIIKLSNTVIDMARTHVEMITDKIGIIQPEEDNNKRCCPGEC